MFDVTNHEDKDGVVRMSTTGAGAGEGGGVGGEPPPHASDDSGEGLDGYAILVETKEIASDFGEIEAGIEALLAVANGDQEHICVSLPWVADRLFEEVRLVRERISRLGKTIAAAVSDDGADEG